MIYKTGSVTSFSELLEVLTTTCQAVGWSWSAPILSKGKAFVELTAGTDDWGHGISIRGGTGASLGQLIEPSAARPRIGRIGNKPEFPPIEWPATYHLHVFDDPDEIYLVLNYNINHHIWMAFGVSDVKSLTGTGLWVCGNVGTSGNQSISLDVSGGQTDSSGGGTSSAGFWTLRGTSNISYSQSAIHLGIDGVGWYNNNANGIAAVGNTNASYYISTLAKIVPNSWNQEAPMMPVNTFLRRAQSKISLILRPKFARYIRVDNFETNDTIVLGTEKWRIYPFYLKNVAERNGGVTVYHTGTFGWAIRYE